MQFIAIAEREGQFPHNKSVADSIRTEQSGLLHIPFFFLSVPSRERGEFNLAEDMVMACATTGSSTWSMASLRAALPSPTTPTSRRSWVPLPSRLSLSHLKHPQLLRSFTGLSPVNPLLSAGSEGNINPNCSQPWGKPSGSFFPFAFPPEKSNAFSMLRKYPLCLFLLSFF